MTSNPLICDCNLLWFKNWLLNKSTQTFEARGVQCATPTSVENQPVLSARFCIASESLTSFFFLFVEQGALCHLLPLDPACWFVAADLLLD